MVGCRSIRNGLRRGWENVNLWSDKGPCCGSTVPDARCRRLVGHRRSHAAWLRCLCFFVHNRLISFIVLYIIPRAVASLSAAWFRYCLSGLFQKSYTAASTANSSIAIIAICSVICTAFYSSQFLLGNLQKCFVVGCGVAHHISHTA